MLDAPRKSKLGQTSDRADQVIIAPRTLNSTSGAKTSVHTPQPSSAPVRAALALATEAVMLARA